MNRTAQHPAPNPLPNYHVSFDELSQQEKDIYKARANNARPMIVKNYSEVYEEQNEARRKEYMLEFLDKAKMKLM